MDSDFACGVIFEYSILSCLAHHHGSECVVWYFSGQSNYGHIIIHKIVALEAYVPCILSLNQWDFDGATILWMNV